MNKYVDNLVPRAFPFIVGDEEGKSPGNEVDELRAKTIASFTNILNTGTNGVAQS